MIACKTYDEARLAIINVLSNFDNYVSHLHIIKVDGTYYADYGGATCSEFITKAINYIMDLHLIKYTFYNPDMLLCEKKEAFENIYRGIEEYVTWYWKTVIVKDFEWSDF